MNSFLLSSSSSSSSTSCSSNFTIFTQSQNPNHLFKFRFKLPILPSHSSPSHHIAVNPQCSLRDSSSTTVLEKKPVSTQTLDDVVSREADSGNTVSAEDSVLVVRRPVKEFSGEEEKQQVEDSDSKTLAIDAGLKEFAKKMPMFEPVRVESETKEKPLVVNLDLALYRAKVLARNFQYEEAEAMLEKCIEYWPEDGRPYVALGKILSKQSKTARAREIYEKGCQTTQGENAYIWQCWAVLEKKMGNTRRARELFDAATVADKRHVAAWHGWAVLELKQGNLKKARNLLAKGLKHCGPNEYIYQTLALLEARANRYQQARYLFKQATKCNPKSCASWLAWAQLEMQQENNHAARQLFENAVNASPKNRFAWHVWGIFEASVGNIDKGRKLLKIGHALNPRDAVLLQSLALLEYKHSTANLARVLFRRASQLDPKHQPVWIAWGWMEWKEGNLNTARELYQKALSIDSTSESAARCLQSFVTWMTWASLEEQQGNSIRAEEIRDLYFQQRTEVVDDASWVMGFLDIIDPAIDSLKRLLKVDQNLYRLNDNNADSESTTPSPSSIDGNDVDSESGFNVDAFVMDRLSLDTSKLDDLLETPRNSFSKRSLSPRRIWRSSDNRLSKSSITA
ncbi:protein high chlorophyll fluorescent 107 isoform X2 [Prosopis cineraria]|uniref:protein high chlorophyll fluorescent 107 isoform X2 n=1 Tax=Prosopis cineraria TaxID=364024 RepID=UPI0024108FF6|nr:protein high chlorophyll fluorescent 107 isoform X2 [Prosopis cineraria]